MSDSCARMPLDALADGEADPAPMEAHLASCADCRAELAALRALKARLARVALPDPPRAFDRSRLRPRRSLWAAAAAAVVAAVVLLSLGTPPPPLLAASLRLHDDVLGGRVVLGDLGIPPSGTKADYAGRCPCPPDLGSSSPFIVYRTGDVHVSLLAMKDVEPAPDSLRRVGGALVLAESRAGLRLLWIARLDEAALRKAVDRLRPPAGLSLREFTCTACCALLDARGKPDADGPRTLELLTDVDGSRLDPSRGAAGLRPAAR